eukprot:2147557-Rhodomonas_salina.2
MPSAPRRWRRRSSAAATLRARASAEETGTRPLASACPWRGAACRGSGAASTPSEQVLEVSLLVRKHSRLDPRHLGHRRIELFGLPDGLRVRAPPGRVVHEAMVPLRHLLLVVEPRGLVPHLLHFVKGLAVGDE